ncbi:MAG: chemotaxis protein CheC, partial [candidate division NC10 bacterium]
LQLHLSFAVPQLHLESLSGLLGSILVGTEELRYALVISTRFHILQSEVSGYMMIALGVASMDRLLQAVETMG